MKFNNTLMQVLKLGATLIVSWLISILIFAAVVPDLDKSNQYDLWIGISTAVIAVISYSIIDFNRVQRYKYKAQKAEADAQSAKQLLDTLIEKADKVTFKYVYREAEVFDNFAAARGSANGNTGAGKFFEHIKNGTDFKAIVESYPELRSNQSVLKLLDQIEQAEYNMLNMRNRFTEAASNFNADIHKFPTNLFKKIMKWEDIDINKFNMTDIVSDEELGI